MFLPLTLLIALTAPRPAVVPSAVTPGREFSIPRHTVPTDVTPALRSER